MTSSTLGFFSFARFHTGDNVWSASVSLTKCKIKEDKRAGGRGSGLGGGGQDHKCPVRLSVAPRRPPDTLDARTR